MEVNVPMQLNINDLRNMGLQPGETEMPCEDKPKQTGESAPMEEEVLLVPDESIVQQLVSMGFEENGCRRAVLAVQNAGVDQAVSWVFEHIEDSNFNDPLNTDDAAGCVRSSSTTTGGKSTAADYAEALATLISIGFEKDLAAAALDRMNGDAQRAADFLLTHGPEDLQSNTPPIDGCDTTADESKNKDSAGEDSSSLTDGPGNYTLIGFISHIGKNTSSGHYIVHIIKNGQWVIFNDRKVAISKEPPLCHGYIYLYGRVES